MISRNFLKAHFRAKQKLHPYLTSTSINFFSFLNENQWRTRWTNDVKMNKTGDSMFVDLLPRNAQFIDPDIETTTSTKVPIYTPYMVNKSSEFIAKLFRLNSNRPIPRCSKSVTN